MHLADHIRPLLRDHDCVIIPDFGGLVADVSPARAQPGRQALSPPTKLVAFNQALTRNDGLLVDALSQHLGLSIAQAREAVRAAVAGLRQELDETNRTELPGIGIFRRAAGRGLSFEYTGTDNLLAAAFGLPELAARPVRLADARVKSTQPILRSGGTRRSTLARLLPTSIIAVAACLLLLANYQVALKAGYLPVSWQAAMPQWEWPQRQPGSMATVITEPQQATLSQQNFSATANINARATEGMTPVENTVALPVPEMVGDSSAQASLPLKKEAPKAVASAIIPAEEAAPVATKAVASSTPAVAAAPVPPAAAPVRTEAVAASASAVTIKSRTGRYYVIAGAYRSLAGAEQGRKLLAKSGHASRIILPPYGSRLFRLTAADYPDLPSAQREAQRLRVSTHCDYNTLKF
jgi:CCDC81-like prokaryotic HU domain 1/CCDC81-like prokaryotic HU domain 2/SPOR domain